MRRLESLLSRRLTRAEAGNPAFDSEFFRPPGGALRERWEERRARRERASAGCSITAQALLLSYKPGFDGSLWLLEARTGPRDQAALGAQARRTLECANLLVSRELPALVAGHAAPNWAIARIATGGEHVLDGESFGLSMCLAAAAHGLGLPSPTHIAATAGVGSDGELFEVGGLREKLHILNEWALGVDTVLVAADQAEAAQSIARELGASFGILGVRSVSDAIAQAFPHLWADLESRWGKPAVCAQVAHDLFRLARDGSNQVLSWRGIAEAAQRIAALLPPDSTSFKDAQFAERVALRHDGRPALLQLDIEYLRTMRRPLRLRCLAHVIQSHADCAETLDPALERTTLEWIPADPRDDSADDLWLLGALGRTLAAFFRYPESQAALQRSVQGWFELDAVANASHALSELLRVLAVTNQARAFQETVDRYAVPFIADARTPTISRGFVLYSLGRGYALLAEAPKAYEVLTRDDCDWALLPDHLRAMRQRWLIRIARVVGNRAVVAQSSAQLLALVERAPHLRAAWDLAELDETLLAGGDSSLALTRLAQSRPIEFRRIAATYREPIGERVAREYRY